MNNLLQRNIKEMLIGCVAAVLIFLYYIGFNLLPFIVVAAAGLFIFLMLRAKGKVGIGSKKSKRSRKPAYLTFDDIGGQDRAKNELKEALDFLLKQDEIKKLGIRPLKGILLTGPPGTGKTLMAKAAAHYSDSVFVSSSGSEFVEMYVGVGASRIRELFKEARAKAEKENKDSAVVFIDEIDVIGGKRDGGQHREYDQTLNQLLTEMDGMHTSQSPRILLIAATNRKEMLDPALLRPGRFDRHIGVDLPDKKGRLHILKLHAKNKPIAEHVDFDQLASESFGFSGAQLESVMNEAAIYAMRDEHAQIGPGHFSQALDKVMLGERTDRESSAEERQRVATHELGHAIIAEIVRPGAVSQVSLSPRGRALGFVRHNPQKDQYLHTKEFIEQQIMIALGGSAAEEIFYGGRSTGSKNDFEQALQLVQTMIDSGLTELGIVNLQMLTKEEYQRENSRILNGLFKQTKASLEQHRHVFEASLKILIEQENLSGERFRELLQDSLQIA